MTPPIEHVRIGSKCKEILIKIKRKTGIEHWNTLCRLGMCKSFSETSLIDMKVDNSDSAIDMDWRTFAGAHQSELASLIIYKAYLDHVNISNKDSIALYVKKHIERGIVLLNNSENLSSLIYQATIRN